MGLPAPEAWHRSTARPGSAVLATSRGHRPPPLVVPASLRPRWYPGARGHTSGLRLPQHRPGRGGPLAPFLGRERSAPACRGREGCLGPSVSRAAAHAPAQRTRACSEPGALVARASRSPEPGGPAWRPVISRSRSVREARGAPPGRPERAERRRRQLKCSGAGPPPTVPALGPSCPR